MENISIYFEDECEIKQDVLDLVDKLISKQDINLFTSGTTGKPKEIKKETNNILNTKKAGNSEEKWLLTFDPKRWSGVSVMSHIIKSECSVYVPMSLSYKDIIECGFKNKVTHISVTPSMFRTILLNDKDDKFKKIPFKQITFGGEVAKQSVLTTATKTFPEARISHVYASTETGDICSVSDGLEGVPKYKFEKDNFKFNDKNELIFKDLNTQDIWELSEKGDRYLFKGRLQEIINVGGVKVSPHKVEEEAISAGAKFAKAYSVKNPILGSLVGLDYVGEINSEDLKKILKEKLSKYEVPSKINKLDEIKLSETGKLKRINNEKSND